jgi:hypothetical protein
VSELRLIVNFPHCGKIRTTWPSVTSEHRRTVRSRNGFI